MKNDPNIFKLKQQKLASIPLPDGYAYGFSLLDAVNAELEQSGLQPITNQTVLACTLAYHRNKKQLPSFPVLLGKQSNVYAYPVAQVVQLYKNARVRRPAHHTPTAHIFAPLPAKYALDPNWLPLSTIAKILGCPIKRLHGFTKEQSPARVFLDPKTKRKLANLEAIARLLPWRRAQWLKKHTHPAQYAYIIQTAPKKIVKSSTYAKTYYYCPSLSHL